MPRVVVAPAWRSPDNCAAVYLGDCLEVMPRLPAQSVDLVFADPPFNIGYGYDVHQDTLSDVDYLAWCAHWLGGCKRLLKPHGAIWVAMGLKYQAEVKVLMNKLGFVWQDTVAWHYTFGPAQETKLTPSWVAMHYATMSSKVWTWNKDATVRVPSARQLKYGDKRANPEGKMPDNCWCLLPGEWEGRGVFMPGQNAWLGSRVCGTFKERTLHPCQMPLPVLGRVVALTSRPGDTVMDPFLGSGTTAEAALKLGRKCVGIELSAAYVNDIIIPRLSAYSPGEAGTGTTPDSMEALFG
jgi:site-specific DNA-methyltransferase (adenine-specific)